jgi:transposase
MKNYKFFLGIDVSKDTFDACIVDKDGKHLSEKAFNNEKEGFVEFHDWVKRHAGSRSVKKGLFCLEFTGHYALQLCLFLEAKEITYACLPPAEILGKPGFKRGKSDQIDARRLADYAMRYKDQVQPYKLRESDLRRVQTLIAFRNRLVKERASADQFHQGT